MPLIPGPPSFSRFLRSMPWLKVLGSTIGDEFYNPDAKARETVVIKFGSSPRFEAAAEFYAYLAYPDQTEAARRESYRIALSRWAVMERATFDREWKESTELERSIRPLIFCQTEKFFQKEYQRGTKTWWKRATLCLHMLLPHINDLKGLAPQVQNIAMIVGEQLGYKSTSYKTVEADIWAPAKPVAHALTAVLVAFHLICDEFKWVEKHNSCYQNAMLATLFHDDIFVQYVLALAEFLRIQIPSCTRFTIREEDLIRFVEPLWL